MILQDVRDKLDGLLSDKTLILDEDSLAVDGIRAQFQNHLGVEALSLTNIKEIVLDGNAVTFSGCTTFLHIRDLPIDVVLTIVNNKLHITFSGRLIALWNFKRSKPQLPDGSDAATRPVGKEGIIALFEQIETEDPQLIFTSHAHRDDQTQYDLAQGINLVWKDPDSLAGSPAALGGRLVLEKDRYTCRLDLPLNVDLGRISFTQISMEIVNQLTPGGSGEMSSVGLRGTLRADQIEIAVEGRLNIVDLGIDLFGVFDHVQINGLQALKDLIGIDDLGTHLPKGLQTLPGLALTDVHLSFDPLRAEVRSISIGFATTQSWLVMPHLFTVTDIGFRGRIDRPFDPVHQSLTATISGRLTISGKEVMVRAHLPEGVLEGELASGQTIPLKDLFSTYCPGIQGFPKVDVRRLGVCVDPVRQSYFFGTVLASDWTVDVGIARLELTEVHADLGLVEGSPAGGLQGTLMLADAAFVIKAAFPDMSMSGYLRDDATVGLKKIIEELIPGPEVVPDAFGDVLVLSPAFAVRPSTKEFSFQGGCVDVWRLSLGVADIAIEEIDVDIARTKISGSKYDITARLAGAFTMAGDRFAVTIEKYGDGARWRLEAHLQGGLTIDLQDMVNSFMPVGIDVPVELLQIAIQDAQIHFDMLTRSVSFSATTSAAIQFAALGRVEATDVAFEVREAGPGATNHHWRITVAGELALANGFHLKGALECYDDDRGAGFAFIPAAMDPIPVVLPLPLYQGKDIALGVTFGPIAIAGRNNTLALQAELTVAFVNLPPFFDDLIGDAITATFAADKDAFRLTLDRIFSGAEFQIPPVPVSATQSVDLGAMRLDLTDVQLLLGDTIECSGKFGVGIPSKLNNVFGVKPDGRPRYEIFNTYRPSQPAASLINFHLGAGTAGVTFTLMDSPFKALTFTGVGDTTWCELDFGQCGALRFMIPAFSLETSSSSFKAAGAAEVIRPLKLPLGLIKNFFSENGQHGLADALPDRLEMKSIRLLDHNNQIRINTLVTHVEQMIGGGFEFPPEVKDALRILEDKFDHLPDRLKGYLNIEIPDAFAFDVAITPDGGATINVQITGEPVRFLIANPNTPLLLGLEFRGFSFGEILSGQLFLVKADFTLDYFDIYGLAAAFLPADRLTFLADSRTLQNSIIVRNLTMFIFYQSQVPVPIPLFYDELALEYKGIEDLEFQTHVRFPQPKLDPMEMIRLIGELQKFFADKNYLLDPDMPLDHIDPKFTLGANFLCLPKYLGGDLLGKRTDIGSMTLYQLLAHLLNGLKTFSVNRLIRAIPLEKRAGTQPVSFLGTTYQAQWLITTPGEFTQESYTRLNLAPAEKTGVLSILPGRSSDDEEGLAMFLKGTGAAAAAQTKALFAIFGSQRAVATGFRIGGTLAGSLAPYRMDGIVKVEPRQTAPFILSGSIELRLLDTPMLAAQIGYDDQGLTFSGQLRLFPANPVLKAQGAVGGRFNQHEAKIAGQVEFRVGDYFELSGAAVLITPDRFTLTGTYCQQSVRLDVHKKDQGLQFSAGLSPLNAGTVLHITGPSTRNGPNLLLDAEADKPPVVTLQGSVQLLGVDTQATVALTADGAGFNAEGKIFGRYPATLEVKTSTNLLNAAGITVTGTMQNDFIGQTQSAAGQRLKDLGRQSAQKVRQAQQQVDNARKALDLILEQIDQEARRIEKELKATLQKAQQQVNQAQARVDQVQTKLDNTQKQVNKARDDAVAAMNQAQKKLDDVNKDIKKVADRIKVLQDRLAKCKINEVAKKVQISAEIVQKETEKAGLVTAKGTAVQVLNAAKAVVAQATQAASQAIAAVNNELAAVKQQLNPAKKKLADAQKALANIGSDARLASLNTVKKAKDATLNQATAVLNQIKKAEKAGLALDAHIQQHGMSTALRIQSAAFTGQLAGVHAGRVSMTIRYRLMNGGLKTMAVPFDFNHPAQSMIEIAGAAMKAP